MLTKKPQIPDDLNWLLYPNSFVPIIFLSFPRATTSSSKNYESSPRRVFFVYRCHFCFVMKMNDVINLLLSNFFLI